MKTNHTFSRLALVLGVTGALAGCNDSFMDRYPETSLTEETFFKTVSDLETYTNNMYGYLSGSYWDPATDNSLFVNTSSTFDLLGGTVNTETVGTWSWGDIRNVNYMLARTGNVTGDQADINHYIGLARMYRAKLYYDKVWAYSDVPWYDHDLQTDDTEELYKTQDPRSVVVDNIMADLDFAIANMKEGTSKTKVNRDVALALQARIALYEGTWRKYHDELGLTDGDRFLNIAIQACEQLMDGSYSLSTESFNGLGAYESLFCNTDLTDNPEMILVTDYDKALGIFHNSQQVTAYLGLSRDLMEDYLVIEDGKTKRFQDVEGYATKTYSEIFENRDPRMRQTFMWPGYQRANATSPWIPSLNAGGYIPIKFDPRSADQITWNGSYFDLPVFRYGEILLIYAEAKAELGTLSQDDLDKSINLLRDRAGMPHASLSDWLTNIDPVQAERYPNVVSAQTGAVLEVRRERRIELANEGFRYDDLMRWKRGTLLNAAPEGMYFPGPGKYDLTGDGKNDIAIVMTEAESEERRDEFSNEGLTVYTMEGNNIEMSEGDHGYIRLVSQVDAFDFVEPAYYYTPIDTEDIRLNENLKQNPFWE